MLPCTALDNFSQCNGFSFFVLPLFGLILRGRPRPFALPGLISGGGGDGEPIFGTALPGGVGGGGAKGRPEEFWVGRQGAEGTLEEFFEGGGGGAEGMHEEFPVPLLCMAEKFGTGGACGGTGGETLGSAGCPELRGGGGGGGGVVLTGRLSCKGGVSGGGGVSAEGGVNGDGVEDPFKLEEAANGVGDRGGRGGGGHGGGSRAEGVMLLPCE